MSSVEGEAAIKDLADKADYDHLLKDMEAIKNDILNLAGHITDVLNVVGGAAQKQTRRGYKQARSKVDSIISDIGKQGDAIWEAAQDAAATLENTLEDSVQERPLAAIGLALGLGFLIGMSWRR